MLIKTAYINSTGGMGLVASQDIRAGNVIGEYRGKVMTSSEADMIPMERAHYLMSARTASDRRKKVVIDGNPQLYDNIIGFANYVCHRYANSEFVDDAANAADGDLTRVLLRACKNICKGQEIRVDYDRGSKSHPFRDQMVNQGIPLCDLNSPFYLDINYR